MKSRILSFVMAVAFFSATTLSFAATRLEDEGVLLGYINAIDVVGSGLTATRIGIEGTLTIDIAAGGAGTFLKLDTSNDPLTNTLDGASLDFTGHAAIGANASNSAFTVLDIDETLIGIDTTMYGVFAQLDLAPAGALSAATHLIAMDMQAMWTGAVDGTTHGSVQGIKGEGINGSATHGIAECVGVYGKASNLEETNVTDVIAGLFFATNDDSFGTEEGDVASAYSLLAQAFTDKDTGVITNRYGLYIEDTTGGGLLTNQYGLYIEDMASGSASGIEYAIFSLGGNVELTDGDVETDGDYHINSVGLTDTGAGVSGAGLIGVDVASFAGVLSGTDLTVQLSLDTIDDNVYTKDEVNDLVEGAVFEYFLNDTGSGIGAPEYFIMDPTVTGDAESDFSDTITNDAFLIDSFITVSSQPTFINLMSGLYALHFHAESTNAGGTVKTTRLYWELYKRLAAGPFTETLLLTSEESDVLTISDTEYDVHGVLTTDVVLGATDLLLLKIYANIEDGDPPRNTNPNATIHAEGTTATHFEVRTTIGAFDDRYVLVTGDTMTGTLDMGTNPISNITSATATSFVIGANTLDTNEWAVLDSVTADMVLDWTISVGTIHTDNYIENADQNLFETITGITNNVVADTTTDSLTFTGAGILTIVGTTATDTITFTATEAQDIDAVLTIGATADTESLTLSAGTLTASSITDGTTTLTGGTMDAVLFIDKVSFTQVDNNEFIDSLNDGFMDYAATTEHRFSGPIVRVQGDLWIGNDGDADPAIVFDGDTSNGQINYDEDNSEFELSQDVYIDGTICGFRDNGGGDLEFTENSGGAWTDIGTGGGGGGTYFKHFLVQSAKLTGGDITNSARIDAGDRGWRLLLDDSTEQEATWQFVCDPNYAAGVLTLEILISMTTTQAGDKDVKLDVKVMAASSGDAEDWNSDGFAAERTVTHDLATDQPAGRPRLLTITFSQAQADAMAVDDIVRVHLARDVGVANDATGDVEILDMLWHE